MEATFVQDGVSLDYTPSAAVAAGEVVMRGAVPYVATRPIAANTLGSLRCDGVFDILKDTAIIADGDAIYWHTGGTPVGGTGTGACNNVPYGGYLLGQAQEAAVTGATEVAVKLLPGVNLLRNGAFPYFTKGNLLTTAEGDQDTYEAVLLAKKAYEFGTVRETAEGDEFVYAYADTGGVQSEFGAVNPIASIAGAVAPTQAEDAGGVGDVKVTFTVAASGTGTSGAAGDGAVALNELVGGMLWIGNGTSQHPQKRRITGNTAVTGGGVCTATFDSPLTGAVTGLNIEVSANPYRYTKSANVVNSAYESVVGIPAVTCAAGYCYWLQRKGMVWVTSDGITGEAANGRDAFFQSNGSIVTGSSTTYACRQRAGYTMDKSASNASNAPNLMLQL